MRHVQGKEAVFCPQCGSSLVKTHLYGKIRPFCQKCGFVFYHDPKVAVGIIATKDGKVLLGRRSHEPMAGKWSFPSGFVDAGEKLEEAAAREIREETKVEVRLERLVGVYSEAGAPVILVVYAGTIVGGQPSPTAEVDEVGFFSLDDLPELAFAHDEQVLRDWVSLERAQL